MFFMTRAQAEAAAASRQRRDLAGKWMAVERDGEWVVARVSLAPDAVKQMKVAVPTSPVAPREPPFSELETVVRKYGMGG
jgi:hypothetical protein